MFSALIAPPLPYWFFPPPVFGPVLVLFLVLCSCCCSFPPLVFGPFLLLYIGSFLLLFLVLPEVSRVIVAVLPSAQLPLFVSTATILALTHSCATLRKKTSCNSIGRVQQQTNVARNACKSNRMRNSRSVMVQNGKTGSGAWFDCSDTKIKNHKKSWKNHGHDFAKKWPMILKIAK